MGLLHNKNNSNDESVNSNSFTENNTDQIFGFDPRSFYTSTNNAWASSVDATEKDIV